MARTRATAVSALILAVGLTGAAVSPFVIQAASASAYALEPPPVEGCDAGEVCDPEVTITQTVTESPEPEQPETTITKTVTKSPTPKPTKTPKSTPTPKASSPASQPQPIVPSSPNVPVPTPSAEQPATEAPVQLPTVAGSQPPTTTSPTPPVSEEPTEESQQLELRNAAPEFDQRTLTQKLSIPALVLVLLTLFAVLIFEGRLRRMAHAAAVRKAGPAPDPHGYPAGPAYTAYPGAHPSGPHPPQGGYHPGYPGGTAYAPIISFVPVQTYPANQPAYQDPGHYTQPYPQQPPAPEPPAEPVVLHPDEFDSYSHEPEDDKVRGAFEPLVPPEAPPADIPSGGSGPYDATREMPLSPGSAAEPGDEDLFRRD
ncbi:hypothetical protein ACIBHY_21755 [Nonomuraea sp. NPDC050547]|uniref:hypothetical protein n=1 Tax=Nonomuraea sp. NPDC050547 TaxID=3364368 RepID=UPI00378BC0FC